MRTWATKECGDVTNFVDYILGGVGSGTIIALMALALVLTWRATRVVNFAQVGQAMFTTFIALSIQTLTGSWFVALVGAIIAGALLGVIVQYLVLRPVKRMDTSGAIIATFGVLIALQAAAGMIWGGDSQNYPQPFGNTAISLFGREWPLSAYDLVVIGFGAVMVIGLTLLFTRTNLGLAMRAAAFNPEVARLSGVRVSRTLTIGWALAGIVGAVAGVLVAPTSASHRTASTSCSCSPSPQRSSAASTASSARWPWASAPDSSCPVVSGYSDSSNAPVVALVFSP